jgi:hypothetical protein
VLQQRDAVAQSLQAFLNGQAGGTASVGASATVNPDSSAAPVGTALQSVGQAQRLLSQVQARLPRMEPSSRPLVLQMACPDHPE